MASEGGKDDFRLKAKEARDHSLFEDEFKHLIAAGDALGDLDEEMLILLVANSKSRGKPKLASAFTLLQSNHLKNDSCTVNCNILKKHLELATVSNDLERTIELLGHFVMQCQVGEDVVIANFLYEIGDLVHSLLNSPAPSLVSKVFTNPDITQLSILEFVLLRLITMLIVRWACFSVSKCSHNFYVRVYGNQAKWYTRFICKLGSNVVEPSSIARLRSVKSSWFEAIFRTWASATKDLLHHTCRGLPFPAPFNKLTYWLRALPILGFNELLGRAPRRIPRTYFPCADGVSRAVADGYPEQTSLNQDVYIALLHHGIYHGLEEMSDFVTPLLGTSGHEEWKQLFEPWLRYLTVSFAESKDWWLKSGEHPFSTLCYQKSVEVSDIFVYILQRFDNRSLSYALQEKRIFILLAQILQYYADKLGRLTKFSQRHVFFLIHAMFFPIDLAFSTWSTQPLMELVSCGEFTSGVLDFAKAFLRFQFPKPLWSDHDKTHCLDCVLGLMTLFANISPALREQMFEQVAAPSELVAIIRSKKLFTFQGFRSTAFALRYCSEDEKALFKADTAFLEKTFSALLRDLAGTDPKLTAIDAARRLVGLNGTLQFISREQLAQVLRAERLLPPKFCSLLVKYTDLRIEYFNSNLTDSHILSCTAASCLATLSGFSKEFAESVNQAIKKQPRFLARLREFCAKN